MKVAPKPLLSPELPWHQENVNITALQHEQPGIDINYMQPENTVSCTQCSLLNFGFVSENFLLTLTI
jgi:hypothetical protein